MSSASELDPTLPLSPAQKDTIYALSTPPGRSGIAVIRVSGPRVLDVYHTVVKRRGNNPHSWLKGPEPWKLHRCSVVDPVSKRVLDEGLAVYFAAPRSFTTEDVLELHIHSGPAIVSAALSALSKVPGCRMAERGEFTRRAFEKGRIDMTQVEGLKDLIEAETEEQRKWALGAVQGKVKDEVEELRQEIISCLMYCEAEIDFGDTEEIDEDVLEKAKAQATSLLEKLRVHLKDSRKGEILRSGIKLVIFGEPNAGKSSLLNWLAQREAAIVTSVPGTTRDILEVSLDLGGLPIRVCDTAGIRLTNDPVESIGVQRAEDAVKNSDVALCVISIPELEERHRDARDSTVSQSLHVLAPLVTKETFVLFNKVDLAREPAEGYGSFLSNLIWTEDIAVKNGAEGSTGFDFRSRSWRASVTTGEGMNTFVDGLVEAIRHQYGMVQQQQSGKDNRVSFSAGREPTGKEPLIRHARQKAHLENAVRYMEAFMRCMEEDVSNVVLGAEELRYAAREIGLISRAVTVDDVLDAVFKDFCIGK